MAIGIVTSRQDPAGRNIRKYLLEAVSWEKMGNFEQEMTLRNENFIFLETERSLLEANHLESHFNVDLWVFASKHSANSGINSFTVHAPGNWGEAVYGGRTEELAFTDADIVKNCFLKLKELGKDSDSQITLEVTHHGPTELGKPIIFVEIGSDFSNWQNEKNGEIVGKTILSLKNNQKWIKCVGFGGTHYAPSFSKLLIDSNISIGHIGPKHANLSEKMIKMAFNRTLDCEKIILDWKGLKKEQKDLIKKVADNLGVEVLRTDQF